MCWCKQMLPIMDEMCLFSVNTVLKQQWTPVITRGGPSLTAWYADQA